MLNLRGKIFLKAHFVDKLEANDGFRKLRSKTAFVNFHYSFMSLEYFSSIVPSQDISV